MPAVGSSTGTRPSGSIACLMNAATSRGVKNCCNPRTSPCGWCRAHRGRSRALHQSGLRRTARRACHHRRDLRLQPLQTWAVLSNGPTPCEADAGRAARPTGVRKSRRHGHTRESRLPILDRSVGRQRAPAESRPARVAGDRRDTRRGRGVIVDRAALLGHISMGNGGKGWLPAELQQSRFAVGACHVMPLGRTHSPCQPAKRLRIAPWPAERSWKASMCRVLQVFPGVTVPVIFPMPLGRD